MQLGVITGGQTENNTLSEIHMHYAEALEEYNKIEQETNDELG